MFGRSFEAVESALEKPEGISWGVGTTGWRAEDVAFIRGKGRLTERLLDIAAAKGAFVVNGKGHDEAEFDLGDNGRKAVRDGPGMWV